MALPEAQLKPVASDHRAWLRERLLLAGKFVVSAACLWYALRRVNLSETLQALPALDAHWLVFALLVAALQIPLLAVRWRGVVGSLVEQPGRLTYIVAIKITAICVLFAQVMPGFMSEGIRVWMLLRLGYNWREALSSVAIDRAVGVGALAAAVIVILLLPSPLATLLGYRGIVLVVLGSVLIASLLVLFLTPYLAPMLRRWRYTYWLGIFASDTHRVLLGPRASVILGAAFAVHLLTIIVIWSLACAEGIALTPLACAVLFGVIVGVALVPITISGWGVREITVVSLLGAYGIAPEKALLFSLCYGLVFAVAALPGAIVWIFFPLADAPSRINPYTGQSKYARSD